MNNVEENLKKKQENTIATKLFFRMVYRQKSAGKVEKYTFDVHEATWKIGSRREGKNDNRINLGRNIYSHNAKECM